MARRKRFETYEERYYLSWTATGNSVDAATRKHNREWRRRTVIYHYSNGTNQCSIAGCNAPVDALTLDHLEFNKVELSESFGLKSAIGGDGLVNMLIDNNFPDVPIDVKCMHHNQLNRNPKNKEGKTTQRRIKQRLQAYTLYGYMSIAEGMTWEHSSSDGAIHRLYLKIKYNIKSVPNKISGTLFNELVIRENRSNLPNWPNLILLHRNDNHVLGTKARSRVNYALFWTEDKYKPFRDSLTEEQRERILNETA